MGEQVYYWTIDILENDEPEVFDKVDLKIKTSDLYDKIKDCLTDRERLIIVLRYGLSDKGEKTQKREEAQET